jgi:lysophospholipase L1-like esterase
MRRTLKIVGVNLGVLLAAALIAELIFGAWLSDDPLDRVNIQRDIELRIDARGLYPEGTVFTYRRDHWGFRGAPGIDPASIDVVTIGGSTTNQLYLPETATWQTILQARARELGSPLTIANAGLEGQTTIGMTFNLEAWFPFVPGLKPKYILAYVGLNDVFLGSSTTDTLSFLNLERRLKYNSALYRLGTVIRGTLQARAERIAHFPVDFAAAQWTDKPAYDDNRQARPEADPEGYRRRLVQLAHRIRDFGAEPVFVTQRRGDSFVKDHKLFGVAAPSGMNGVDHWRLLDAFNDVTVEVCEAERIKCIDLARHVAFEIGDFYDVVHTTPQGAEKVGRFIAEALIERHP